MNSLRALVQMLSTVLQAALLLVFFSAATANGEGHNSHRMLGYYSPTVRTYHFNIAYKDVYPDCAMKTIIAVNNQFPGPTIEMTEGDTLEVHVTNNVQSNISLHWHGFLQKYSKGGNPWHDGPAYITQCPIPPGGKYTYRFKVDGQRGTFFWHGHRAYLVGELFGKLVVHPKPGALVPFARPAGEHFLLLTAWYHFSLEGIFDQELRQYPSIFAGVGGDALLINGRGKFNCTGVTETTFCAGANRNCTVRACEPQRRECDYPVFKVTQGKTYRIRIVNAAMSALFRFAITGHKLTIVETDGAYTKPLVVDYVDISVGQAYSVLVTANQPVGNYWMVAPLRNSFSRVVPAKAILRYFGAGTYEPPAGALPTLPAPSDVQVTLAQHLATRSYDKYPLGEVGKHIEIVVGFGDAPGTNYTTAFLNNHTFVEPTTPLLAAEYYNISGVFTRDFPETVPYKLTDANIATPSRQPSILGASVLPLPYDSVIEIIIQNIVNLIAPTGFRLSFEHPFHLHGHTFFVVGVGSGVWDVETSPKTYNLVDPPEHYTVAVPPAGWAAIRFKADNPGVWNFHCHVQSHMSAGMQTAFVVRKGPGDIPPPPSDTPMCGRLSNYLKA